MPKTNIQTTIKPESPAVPASALRIPVFEEVRQGHFVFVGYVVDDTDAQWIWMKKAA